ncbi:hypothetical protein EW145_g143 [Phellinidium pouzarii]|uniref:FYVE-type domain-containing protein n=1 Tax=Phellinidium pouzarii TaxID=167371 RepID=A0A4S4LJI8_9AGAM|nr:hypothetical protein EW145_g143 [Phellinidium pouzarii]
MTTFASNLSSPRTLQTKLSSASSIALRTKGDDAHATTLAPIIREQDDIDDDDDDDEGFKYPDDDDSEMSNGTDHETEKSEERRSTNPATPEETPKGLGLELSNSLPLTPHEQQQQSHPTAAQLEALYTAGLSGNLTHLKNLVNEATSSGKFEAFALANDASPRTGLTVVHAAASRGHMNALKWLIEDCGGIPDLEDKEGETALHKAALNGHLRVVVYLVGAGAEVNTRDGDGWTALHNSCSKGYLDIVRWLCETGGAAGEVEGVRGADARSKGGWTPLMNAASKGHLPVVLYLLSKQSANSLVRNDWGETAYDIAAAVFEIWICEILQRAEADKWCKTTVPYDPLAVHTTVPIILYEHQRLDIRLKTLAVNGGRPKFSASGLGKKGRRAPFELRLPKLDEDSGKREVPAWRSDVQLPLVEDPFTLPKPTSAKDGPSREGAERSHFWLSDWTLDLTYPRVDAEEGWQYSHSFAAAEDQWSADLPLPLERLLSGAGAMAAGLGGPSNRSSSSVRSSGPQAWVRRRRWVRVMRRRLDIPPLPFLGPDGAMYKLSSDGSLVSHVSDDPNNGYDEEGHELGAMPSSFLSLSQDYVARSRYLAGTPSGTDTFVSGNGESAVDTKRAIAKLERAVMELRTGMLGDEDTERRTQAEVLLNVYSRELERKRLSAGAAGLFLSDDSMNEENEEDDSDDESFHYPGSSPTSTTTQRPPSLRSQRSQAADYLNRPTILRTSTDLTPHLSQAPEFRVPTHEAPQKVMLPRGSTPTSHSIHVQWERDDAVSECHACKRRFSFLFRKHCRRCGKIFCDRCSSYRVALDPADTVHDPAFPEGIQSHTTLQRVCENCLEETNASASIPSRFQGPSGSSMQRIVVDEDRLAIPTNLRRSESSSQISDLSDCPVCGKNLSEFEMAAEREAHVKNCLEGGDGSIQQPAKYLVYRLPGESQLVGTECQLPKILKTMKDFANQQLPS